MALSDFAVFNEYAYTAMTEILMQQIELFNAASEGTIVLVPSAHQGDYSEEVMYAKIQGLTRRRNVYGDGTIQQKSLERLVDTSVKVAAGTVEMRIDKSMFTWIQRSPEEAGVVIGKQLAVDAMADMLNTGIGTCVAALKQTAEVVRDISTVAAPNDKPSFIELTQTAGLFGDHQSDIRAWIMHSTPLTTLYVNALTNAQQLFTYGTVNVVRDPFGRLFVVTDSPNLQWAGTTPEIGFYTLGLTNGAIYVGQNNDFDAVTQESTGSENLKRTWQAEWTFNSGVKGYAWDKANGGKSPTDAALLTSSNWDRYATSHKDLAGVILKSH